VALTDSLVSYWSLDEASGNALDAHGANDLSDNNTVGTATGKINGGRDFERDNSEYFRLADNASLSTGDIDFTFTAWVKFETLTSGMTQVILSKWDDVLDFEYWLAFFGSSDKLTFYVSSSGGTLTFTDTTAVASAGVWYFVVAWHDAAANTINLQVNDGAVASASHSAGVRDGASAFCIGAQANPTNYTDGVIDEVGFWKRVLTSDERTQLYNAGAGLAYPFAAGGTVIPILMHHYRRRRVA
jgi:hypothetical protein